MNSLYKLFDDTDLIFVRTAQGNPILDKDIISFVQRMRFGKYIFEDKKDWRMSIKLMAVGGKRNVPTLGGVVINSDGTLTFD